MKQTLHDFLKFIWDQGVSFHWDESTWLSIDDPPIRDWIAEFVNERSGEKMEIRNIKDMVKDGKKVRFVKYLDGNLYYRTECGFEFPVPTSDVGNATFLSEDRAMLFMRYIRKHLEVIQEGTQEST